MALDFEKCASNGDQFLRELSERLGVQYESHKAIRILQSVLHTLRDHLTLEESLEFLAQLPMFLKAIYVDDWKVKEQKKLKYRNDFFVEVWENDGPSASADFGEENETLKVIKIVFLMLRKYVSEEEINEIIAILPNEIKPIIKQTLVA